MNSGSGAAVAAVFLFSGLISTALAAPTCGQLNGFELSGTGAASHAALIADFNGDVEPDLALLGSGGVRVALQSNGRLDPLPQRLAAVQQPFRAVAEDFDQDGDTDLLVTCAGCSGADRVTLYLNRWAHTGQGGFGPGHNVGLGLPALVDAGVPVALDWDGDRDTDLLLFSTSATAGDSVLLENRLAGGLVRFVDRSAALPPGLLSEVTAAVALDANGDRRIDVYVARDGKDALLIQQLDGSFADESAAFGLTAADSEIAAVATDLNGDFAPDVLLLRDTGALLALLGDPQAPGLAPHVLNVAAAAPALGVAVADVMRERHPEIFVTSGAGGGTVTTLSWQGNQGGVPTYAALPASDPSSIQAAASGALASLQAGPWTRAVAFADGADPALLCVASRADEDADRVPDWMERAYGLDPGDSGDGRIDQDGDSIPAREEVLFAADPRRDDSDGDGVRDDADLLNGSDLDGDGVAYEGDSCPSFANAARIDRNGNGLGDACDGEVGNGLTTVLVSRDWDGDHAIIGARETSTTRLLGDQRGQMPQGPSFRVFRTPIESGSRELVEYWHPVYRDHAYAATPTQEGDLVSNFYTRLGTLGYLSDHPPAFGEAALLRRFVLTALRRDEAVTTDRVMAEALLGVGYVEQEPLGFVIEDEGRFSTRSRAVVRYSAHGRLTLHSSRLAGDVDVGVMDSDGPQFRVLPEKSGWTIPLYRFRTSDFLEALSTDPEEFERLEAEGYKFDGIIGHIFPFSPTETKEDLTVLVRLTAPDGPRFVHTVHPEDLRRYLDEGFGRMRVLGRVIRQTAEPREPRIVDVDEILRRTLASLPDPMERGAATLIALATACVLERALEGDATTLIERAAVHGLKATDPETRRRALERVRAWHDLDPGARARALGPFAFLDPLDCSLPVDAHLLRVAIMNVLSGDPGYAVFGNPLRAPQCVGPDPNARDVTVTDRAKVHISEASTLEMDFPVKPRLLGVLENQFASSADGIDDPLNDRLFAYASDHGKLGFPLIGVVVDRCIENKCQSTRGERCVAGMCRAYPMINGAGQPTFTGVSFWDLVSARLQFRPVGGGPPPSPIPILRIKSVLNEEQSLAPRCKAEPALMDKGLRSMRSPSFAAVDLGMNYSPLPEEDYLDTALPEILNLEPGRFYEVQIVNQNGTYVPWNEKLEFGPDGKLANGRTVHVCTEATCNPPLDGDAAACAQPTMPACGPTVGGIWQAPLNTPGEFVSDTTFDGLPLLVYVPKEGTPQFLHSRLQSVRCNDETGWDAFGEDELVLIFGSTAQSSPTMEKPEDIADQETRMEAWSADFDARDEKFPREFLSSLSVPLRIFEKGEPQWVVYGLQLGEDDDNIAQLIIAATLGTIGTAAAGVANPIFGVAHGVAAVAVFSAIALTDPDDFIGQDAWTATVPGVRTRGTASHDADPTDSVELLPPVAGLARHIAPFTPYAYKHPAADGDAYDSDVNLPQCTTDPECGTGRRCAFNVCVRQDWYDFTTPPMGSTGISGSLEARAFNGEGHYTVRVSSAVSDRRAVRGER